MEKLLLLILILIVCCILWAIPVWVAVNLICWVFHLSFHLTILQAFAICLLVSVVKGLFKGKED